MFKKKYIVLFYLVLFYQSPSLSKSDTFSDFNSRALSKYFSGIVAFENKSNSKALDFFKSSKILINKHDPYLERFTLSLVLDNKVLQAINLIKSNKNKSNSNFFEAYILLALDNLKKDNINKAIEILDGIPQFLQEDRFNFIILDSIKQYAYVFENKKILKTDQNFGNLSLISETFQRCFLDDKNTYTFFEKLINNNTSDYSRYIFFYLTHLIDKNQIDQAKVITDELNYINTTLLLSQGKSWMDRGQYREFGKVFSCNNHNDLLGEFLFLISNLYSSQNKFEKSNFYLSLSNYLNPKFVFNLSLVVENFYQNDNFDKARSVLKNFNQNQDFYYWYRSKKEAQIISKISNQKEALNFITAKFNKIEKPNKKFLFDIANFNKNSKNYEQAIKYYSLIIDTLDDKDYLKADILYRRGASFERLKNYLSADKDLKNALVIDPNDAYVLNYLAYSWLERDYKINEAIKMLERAYKIEINNPYITDSIGWAYYLVENFEKAETFLKKAVELMPDDPVVNDHYGDILWKLDRKIQARYFWSNVLKMDNADEEMIKSINIKMINGLEKS